MDDRLREMIRALRAERCPDTVRDRVDRRLSERAGAGRWWGPRLAWVLAGVAVAIGLGVVGGRGWRSGPDEAVSAPGSVARVPLPSASTTTTATATAMAGRADVDHQVVLEQAQVALLAIGRMLIDVGGHAEEVLVTDAAPPLIHGFLSAKTKLTNLR